MSEVFADEHLPSNEKLVMLALADESNQEGLAYPSFSTLQIKTSLSRPTVSKILKKLIEKGYLHAAHRSRKNGGRSSNMYLLFPIKNHPKLDEFFQERFKNLSTEKQSQSKQGLPPPQSKGGLLGFGVQSKRGLLECYPLPLKLFKHKGFSCLQADEKDLFLEYLKLRTEMKLKTTYQIQDRLLKKYHKFGRDKAVIENAINSNWKDFYEIKKNAGATGFGKSRSTAQLHHDTLKEIAAEADEREMGGCTVQ